MLKSKSIHKYFWIHNTENKKIKNYFYCIISQIGISYICFRHINVYICIKMIQLIKWIFVQNIINYKIVICTTYTNNINVHLAVLFTCICICTKLSFVMDYILIETLKLIIYYIPIFSIKLCSGILQKILYI